MIAVKRPESVRIVMYSFVRLLRTVYKYTVDGQLDPISVLNALLSVSCPARVCSENSPNVPTLVGVAFKFWFSSVTELPGC